MLIHNHTHTQKHCSLRPEDTRILLFTRSYFQDQIKGVSHGRGWGFFPKLSFISSQMLI